MAEHLWSHLCATKFIKISCGQYINLKSVGWSKRKYIRQEQNTLAIIQNACWSCWCTRTLWLQQQSEVNHLGKYVCYRSHQELQEAIREGLLYMDLPGSRPRSPRGEYSPRWHTAFLTLHLYWDICSHTYRQWRWLCWSRYCHHDLWIYFLSIRLENMC